MYINPYALTMANVYPGRAYTPSDQSNNGSNNSFEGSCGTYGGSNVNLGQLFLELFLRAFLQKLFPSQPCPPPSPPPSPPPVVITPPPPPPTGASTGISTTEVLKVMSMADGYRNGNDPDPTVTQFQLNTLLRNGKLDTTDKQADEYLINNFSTLAQNTSPQASLSSTQLQSLNGDVLL